jgi:hypothetical protein
MHVHLFQRHLQLGLALLLRAYGYAKDSRSCPWEIAVPISDLYDSGLTRTDLHWLLVCRYAEHARETTDVRSDHRRFEHAGRAVIHDDSCFVLTPHGADFAAKLLRLPPIVDDAFSEAETPQPVALYDTAERGDTNHFSSLAIAQPTWCAHSRELFLGKVLVKRFRVPADNQEVILSTFQEEGWPKLIDDPLSPTPEIAPKRRLHDTIAGLNRNQVNRVVRFYGNGTSDGVRWEPIVNSGY